LASGRFDGNTWNVEQGTLIDVETSMIGVPRLGWTITTKAVGVVESGSTFYLNNTAGFTCTLPPVAAGLKYTFVIAAAPSSGDYAVVTEGGDNRLEGYFLDTVGELTAFTGRDIISFVSGSAKVGDRIELECDSYQWHVKAFSGGDGGISTGVT